MPRTTSLATPAAIRAALLRLARPAGEFNAERYFRGDHGLRFYNVGTPAMRALARDVYGAVRDIWSVDDAMPLADSLMRDPYLEMKSIGIEVVAKYRRWFTPALLTRWQTWLADDLSANWATTDAICGWLIGPLLADRPNLIPRLRLWARHPNLWVRRASIVSLILPMRRGLALDLVYDNALALRRDREDLIHKAVGWALREAGKQDEDRLRRFLLEHGAELPRTTVRYAIERFPAGERKSLLERTRADDARGVAAHDA